MGWRLWPEPFSLQRPVCGRQRRRGVMARRKSRWSTCRGFCRSWWVVHGSGRWSEEFDRSLSSTAAGFLVRDALLHGPSATEMRLISSPDLSRRFGTATGNAILEIKMVFKLRSMTICGLVVRRESQRNICRGGHSRHRQLGRLHTANWLCS